ncbi:MAG: CDP-diacylglycerol--glycerol-3-phosphate 3-phosphatidyltransferase [Victivallaceae bacterium]|nr:CDP-diacylglycerol--glycerol-3-phosphate 3-phosphatidyltransferase [Victivallaceae bacterium]
MSGIVGTMNLPNMLTMGRIVLIMVFVGLAANGGTKVEELTPFLFEIRLIAYILAILAGLTDLLDGYLARKWNQVTDFGALMDPLADKIFVTATMLMAVEYHLMPAWIAVVVLSREFMVTGLRSLAAKQQVVISADHWGKIKTASQMVMLVIAGASWVSGATEDLKFDLWTKFTWQWYVWIGYLCAIVLVTVGSGLHYFLKYRYLFWEKGRKTI